jgi:hypothetical protein
MAFVIDAVTVMPVRSAPTISAAVMKWDVNDGITDDEVSTLTACKISVRPPRHSKLTAVTATEVDVGVLVIAI